MTSSPAVRLPRPPRLALVGDRSPSVQAHARIPGLVNASTKVGAEPIELYWLHSTSIASEEDVVGFDGVWVVPGSPYQDTDGVLRAIRGARVNGIPFLGTCGGFQHLVLEFARDVCGLEADNAELNPAAPELIIVPLACSLLGEEDTVTISAGTTAARAMGAGPTTERFFCRYGINTEYLPVLEAHGLVISGRDELGDARVAELSGTGFFVGSLFQPELSSDVTWVHPLIAAFTGAVRDHAAGGPTDGTAGGSGDQARQLEDVSAVVAV